MATRIKFQQNLDELKEKLLVMAGMAEQAIHRSIEAYRTRDLSLCEQVFRSEPAVNRLEREIDQMALDLLAMEQPMAIDLRFILSVIKINGDLERIGDQSTNIAARTIALGALPGISLPVDIKTMGSKVGIMMRRSIQALLEGDSKLAESVLEMDDEIDDMNKLIQAELIEVMKLHPEVAEQSLNAIIISRNLERAADHATNIAEDVIFWIRGNDVRHKFSMLDGPSAEDRHLPVV